MELKRKLALFGRGPKPLFYVPQISQIYTDFPGEGWVKGGEGSAQPFTRASYLATDIYAILVKGEGYF